MADDVVVRSSDLNIDNATAVIQRVHRQYQHGLDIELPIMYIDRSDLATLLVMASLWLTKKE